MTACGECQGAGFVIGPEIRSVVSMPCLCGGGPGPYGERPCSRCGGTGLVTVEELDDPRVPCRRCEGAGVVVPVGSMAPGELRLGVHSTFEDAVEAAARHSHDRQATT